MGLFFYNKIGSIISIGDLPTTNIIEPQKIDGKTYYFETDGVMKKGLLTLGDKQYYLNEKDGILTPNIAVIDGMEEN